MNDDSAFMVKGYYHQTMLRTAYLWLPIFAGVIFICSYLERLRFILYLSIGAATYTFIINQLKEKAVEVSFNTCEIQIDNSKISLSTVENYYISLPLKELIILRICVEGKNEALYLDKIQKENITELLKHANIPDKKILYDNYLQYGHLILPFVGLFICAIIYKLHYYIQYGFAI